MAATLLSLLDGQLLYLLIFLAKPAKQFHSACVAFLTWN